MEDLAAEQQFCSQACLDGRRQASDGVSLTTNREYLLAFDSPIRSGWGLWRRSIQRLALLTAPVAVLMGALIAAFRVSLDDSSSTLGTYLVLAAFLFGVALSQVVVSQQYRGVDAANPYMWTVRRLIPWIATWALLLAATTLGYLLFIIPGIILALRLFWADEFALIHGCNPWKALKQSWELTESSTGQLFGFQVLAGFAAYGVIIVMALPIVGVVGLLESIGMTGRLDAVGNTLMYWAVFVGYGGIHAPEIVYMYGMRAEQSTSVAERSKTLGIT